MDSPFDDNDIMRRVAEHDEQAFQTLYLEYGRAVYSLAYRILQNPALAEEATQDAFLKVWQQKAHWDPTRGKLKNWLLTITQFTAIDCLRRERRQPVVHPEPIEEIGDDVLASLPEPLWQEGSTLRLLIQSLTEDQAKLIDLAFFQGMSHSEIANVTHISLGTVKTRLRTGLHKLRELWLGTVKHKS